MFANAHDFVFQKSQGLGVLNFSSIPHPPGVLSRNPDFAAVTIGTRFLRNYPLPHSYHNNKTENIKAQVKPYSFDRRNFPFLGFIL